MRKLVKKADCLFFSNSKAERAFFAAEAESRGLSAPQVQELVAQRPEVEEIEDSSGARLVHALLVANNEASLELAARLFEANPRLLLQVHVAPGPFSLALLRGCPRGFEAMLPVAGPFEQLQPEAEEAPEVVRDLGRDPPAPSQARSAGLYGGACGARVRGGACGACVGRRTGACARRS